MLELLDGLDRRQVLLLQSQIDERQTCAGRRGRMGRGHDLLPNLHCLIDFTVGQETLAFQEIDLGLGEGIRLVPAH